MDMESLHGLIVDFTKEILLEDKEKENENLNRQTGGYVKESDKLEKSMNFPLKPCRILN